MQMVDEEFGFDVMGYRCMLGVFSFFVKLVIMWENLLKLMIAPLIGET